MDINVTVNNICLLNPDTLNSGEAYIHKLNFNFSEEYTSDLVYRACFTCLSGTYVSPILNNECEIPPEVLENEGIIELGVYAYILEDNTLIKRFSPEHIFIKIIAGSYREGLESEAPTPTEQEQWIDSFNRNYLNKIELFNENAATKTQELADIADEIVERAEEQIFGYVEDKKDELDDTTEDLKVELRQQASTITFSTFEVNATTGMLIINSAEIFGNLGFSVNGNSGELEVEING